MASELAFRMREDGYLMQINQLRSECDQLKAENEKLKALCEWLLNPYRLGAVTGEGVDKQWCRETYDGGTYRLHELGIDAG